MTVILASRSQARAAMLENAGVAVEIVPAHIDEAMLRDSLKSEGVTPRELVDALAQAKSVRVSRRVPGALVLGADQILVTGDGGLLDKPETPAEARLHLQQLSAATHILMSGGGAVARW